MQQWEYMTVSLTIRGLIRWAWSDSAGRKGEYQDQQGWGALLNQLGGQGWELTGVENRYLQTILYFKRPKQ